MQIESSDWNNVAIAKIPYAPFAHTLSVHRIARWMIELRILEFFKLGGGGKINPIKNDCENIEYRRKKRSPDVIMSILFDIFQSNIIFVRQ